MEGMITELKKELADKVVLIKAAKTVDTQTHSNLMSHQCTMTEPTCSSGVDIRDSENNQNENVNDGDENNEGQNKVPMGKGKYVAAPKNIEIEMRKRKKTRICSKITGGQKTKHKKDKGNCKITLTNNSSAEAKAHKETGFTTETAPHEINLHDEFKQSEQEEDSGQSQLHGSGKSEDRISDSPERAMNNRTQEEPLETPQDTTKRKPNKIFISGDHYGKNFPTVLKTIEGIRDINAELSLSVDIRKLADILHYAGWK
ncbi:hypothetical protein JTB14_005086 [Gonioctena quinquepunctata]|nr:hypothetical protein JTB14_005086 [Gonioctena quinquepunctata]